MESSSVIILIVIAVVVLGVGLTFGLVARARSRPDRSGGSGGGDAARQAAGTSGGTATAEPAAPVAADRTEPPEAAGRDAGTVEILEPEALEIERPEPAQGRLTRLRARLARSQTALGKGLLSLLSKDRIDDDTWDEIEETLITADLGVGATGELIERLRTRVRVEGTSSPGDARRVLREELLESIGPAMDRSLRTQRGADGKPAVVLVVGVNGTGKTTTVGKLARVLVAQDGDVVLGAADTFRAAAVDQLATWGDRVGVPTVRGPEGGDPASVAYESVRVGIDSEVDTVIVDTAGRLHTKTGLMDELGKVKRVLEKQAPVTEVLLAIDATTGQNGLTQARVFTEVVDVTGVVLTKLDSTARGGIIVAIQRELGVPVKLVGLGEGPDDLAPFEPEAFVDALLE